MDHWAIEEVTRIEALTSEEVIAELKDIMNGTSYSWHKINGLLQAQLDNEALEFTLDDGDVIYEWNNLCDEKKQWEEHGCLSITDSEFDRDCLINLRILPIKGCAGEGLQFITTNVDEPGFATADLWVDRDQWEFLSRLREARNAERGSSGSEPDC